tara:strand:+ start:843 stop:1106 length:264 start_codon:yes stop_codon:yes gene_type:complete
MLPMNNPDDVETVLAELQAGIIPTSIFLNNHVERKDPFASMDKKEARKMKRKWRKLKKKFGVKNKSLSQQSHEVRFHLRRISRGSRD